MSLFDNSSSFEQFQLQINEDSLYEETSLVIENLLEDMSTLPFKSLVMKEGGTQLKLVINFPRDGQALFKPMRFPRNKTVINDFFIAHEGISIGYDGKIIFYMMEN